MARFWKEKREKKGRKREEERTDAIVQGFYEDPDNSWSLQGRRKSERQRSLSG